MGKVVPPLQSGKTNIPATLTVKSSLDPHMIIELEDGNKLCSILLKWFDLMVIIIYADNKC